MGLKLGDFSPLAGAITGEGLFGEGFANLGDALGDTAGLAPRMAKSKRDNRNNAAAEAEARRMGFNPQGNKKGGAIKKAKGGSASSRGDGCATKGKTKGRFV